VEANPLTRDAVVKTARPGDQDPSSGQQVRDPAAEQQPAAGDQ